MNNISKHVTYREATRSITAKRNNIDNTPGEKELKNMKVIAEMIFEPLRKGLGDKPICISSFYRSNGLNNIIGGSVNSQHLAIRGAAIDIDNEEPSNTEIFNYIKDNLEFDQLIWEYGDKDQPDWVHVSYNDKKNRKQVLRCYDEYPKYRPYE